MSRLRPLPIKHIKAHSTRSIIVMIVCSMLAGALAVIAVWMCLNYVSIDMLFSSLRHQTACHMSRDPRCDTPARYEAMSEGANCS